MFPLWLFLSLTVPSNRDADKRADACLILVNRALLNRTRTLLCFLYRPEVYGITQYTNDNMSTEGVAEIIVSKQRNGPVGDVRLKFLKDYARFENLDLRYNEINTESLPEHTEEEDFPI
jgi:hypothetical protein